jgi:PRTRC genetic system protein E
MTAETQNGFFTQLAPLLAQRAVLITVSKLEEGSQLHVNICPRQLKDGENQALTTPLCITGSPEELDTQLAPQVANFVASYVGFNTNLASIEAELAEAEKNAREEAKKRQKTVGNGGKKAEAAKPEVPPAPQPQQSLGLFDQPAEPAADIQRSEEEEN